MSDRGYIARALTVEWHTPHLLFKFCEKEFGPFDLDAAATKENALCGNFYDKDTNGLKNTWTGRVFCNPPYGRGLGEWIEKAIKDLYHHYCESVTFVLPARTGTKWFHRLLGLNSVSIYFIKGRLKFSDGINPAGFDCMLVHMELKASEPFRVCGLARGEDGWEVVDE